MDFLKKHYEKILLSVVLLGLAVAAGYLPFEVANVREKLAAVTSAVDDPKVAPIPDLNLSTNEAVLARLKGPIVFGFGTGKHGLFNPSGTWMKGKGPGGFPPIPPPPSGLEGLVVTNITPLLLRIEFQGISQSGTSTRYRFYVQNQAASISSLQRGRIVILSTNDKPDVILLKDVIGPKDNPDGFRVELTDARTTVVVPKDKGYSEVAGYSADLRHEGEGRTFLRQKQGSKLTVAGSTYNVVAISASDVTIEDEKTKRRTVISLNR